MAIMTITIFEKRFYRSTDLPTKLWRAGPTMADMKMW